MNDSQTNLQTTGAARETLGIECKPVNARSDMLHSQSKSAGMRVENAISRCEAARLRPESDRRRPERHSGSLQLTPRHSEIADGRRQITENRGNIVD